MNDQHISGPGVPAPAQRKAWIAPRLSRLRAGEAEIGADPAKPELNFAYGS
jgi:hypothetical protein